MNFGTIQVADIFVGALNAIEAYFGTEKVWEKSAPPTANWLCFTAEEVNSTVAMEAVGSAPTVSLEYSTDGSTWSPFVVGTTTVTLANIGDKVYVRATAAGNTGMGTSSYNYNKFVMTGKIAASGNVDTLLDQNGNATLTDCCYNGLFQGCSSLTTAPVLPATTLADSCYYSMFQGCSSLTSAPRLPATTLADSCYYGMFQGCSSLTTAPVLPATTLADSCYRQMFMQCDSLTTAPELPVETLVNNCYYGMFHGCSSLTTAPSLPATTLATNCYSNMFKNCTSLTTAPSLPATTLAERCYVGMFNGCTSLTTAPSLPATTLANFCYSSMFYGCSSLTSVPTLPATTLANNCYQSMFWACSNLNTITLGYTGNFSNTYFNNWVNGVASTGTFYYNGSDTTMGGSAIPSGWTVLPIPTPRSELCFTAEEANSTVGMVASRNAPAVSLECSTDGNTWSPFVVGTTTVTLANIGDKVYVRATSAGNTGFATGYGTNNKFVMTGKIAASGNVDTLLDQNGNATLTNNCYTQLFSGCTSLTTAPSLPATTLADNCYSSMFEGCTALTTAQVLPATTLADYCYNGMFAHCSSLTTAPSLPATTLASGCYQLMFDGCTSLTTAPSLPATTLAVYCYYYMFNGCSSLTTATELPATTLAGDCYNCMFNGCSSLTSAPALPATTLAENCYSGMFSSCTSLTSAPTLPATTLADNCYEGMFAYCQNLEEITIGYTGDFNDTYFMYWVDGVAASGTFYYNGSDTTEGESAIPYGWTVTPFTP